jgi:diguanylate cyclase (GGDEF)-like protein
MDQLVKDIIGKLDAPEVLNSQFSQLLNSISGIRTVSNLGNQQFDEKEFIESVMQTILEHLETEEVSLYLIKEKALNCVARLNWNQFIDNESSINNKINSHSMSSGIIGKTATSREVIHIRNCKTSAEDLIEYKMNGRNIGSLICAPIIANNSLLGVVELSHPDLNHFDLWQEYSIIIYAELVGLLLNNNKLMSDMHNIVDARTEELRHAFEESEKLRKRYEEMSVIDPLTKIYNRRYFFTEVGAGLARAKRYSQPFSLMLMDLDHFKEVNDQYGHECGDKVLVAVSKILGQFTREGDTLARIGGEEFVLALPETDNNGAIKLAERIRNTIEEHPWECNDATMNMKISIGLSSLEDCDDKEIIEGNIQVRDILRKADLALYYVKQHGRNSVKSFSGMS